MRHCAPTWRPGFWHDAAMRRLFATLSLLLSIPLLAAGCGDDAGPATSTDALTDVVAGDTASDDAASDAATLDDGAIVDAVPGDSAGPVGDVSGVVLPDDAQPSDGTAADAVDAAVSADAEVDAAADIVAGPPPLPAAPEWFHQVQLTGVVLDSDGESDDLYVDLPEATTSVFVMVEGDDTAFFTLKKAITPAPLNQSVVKGAGDHICIPCANRVVSSQKLASFLLPNDPEVEVKGGEWLLKVRSTKRVYTPGAGLSWSGLPGTCDVTVLARTAPTPPTGLLRLQLHFTGSDGLDAMVAPTDERVQGVIDTLVERFAPAGIGVEIAGYHDVPGVAEDITLTEVGSTAGSPNDLSKLFLTGQAEDVGAINVFFVTSVFKDLDYEQVGGTVLGVAGGVPGPAFVGPSFRSGVTVATPALIDQPAHFGAVLAHEIGHYLGLFHSTEKDGIFHDTLDDTGEGDGSNLMFWAWSEAQADLTESQAAVIRSHPLVMPD